MLHPCQRRAVMSVLLMPVLMAAACLVAPQVLAQPGAVQEDTLTIDEPAAGAPATVAAVSVSSYQKLLDDVGYLGGLVEMPQASQMVEGMIAMFTQGQGLVGLDKDRPWGLLVQSSGQDFSPLVCLPINDLEGLLALGVNAGITTDDMGDGVKSVSAQGQTYYIKSSGEWAYAAQRADQLAYLPESPADMLGELVNQYDIGVKLMAQNVPPMFKQIAVGQLRQGMQEGLDRRPDETDAQFEARSKLAEANIENIEQLINDLDQAVIGISINPDGGGLMIDFRGTAVAGTKLADQLAIYQASGTKLAGFLAEDASLSFATAYSIPADVLPRVVEEYERQMATARTALTQMLEEADLPNDEVRETLNSALEDVLACAEAMVKSGEVDMVGNIQLKMGGASAIAGLRTPEPEKIDAALKKVAALAEGDPNFPGINWAAETHEGVTLHTLSVPVDDPQAQDVLGGQVNVAVGIGPDAAYFWLGPDGVAALKQAITNSASGTKDVKPVQMSMSLAQVMEFAAAVAEASGEDAAAPQMLAQLLKDADSSQINVTVDGEPNGMRYRVKVDEGVLKAIGKTGAEMQRAQMQ
ncbi:hypothetical protein Pla123a_04880 [Posidoniimonas polymericola]|uniref:Uncharacterized protein n=1 Tax=Posidoniimonas polymericola TaxID=2528002 RepID=A0A5C5ZFQ8_9BACT|nr:hypothetical protein [Posidoniimonas polymericola]TWT85681.1 hypothetical protein Pla123a_04880 [Posidoniimonas polymericola]